jgi:hypothetical protein
MIMEIDRNHAPEGTVAAPCTCGCAGCVFDQPDKDIDLCMERRPSCFMFERPDVRSVIFVPAPSPGGEAKADERWLASALNELDVLERIDG